MNCYFDRKLEMPLGSILNYYKREAFSENHERHALIPLPMWYKSNGRSLSRRDPLGAFMGIANRSVSSSGT